MKKYNIYLDDVRVPKEPGWILVKDYDQFVNKVMELGLENIDTISLDHDLGDTAMREYFHNVAPNFTLDYNNIKEKTGLDCAKWLVELHMNQGGRFPTVYTHSANPIGSANIMGYVNNYWMNLRQPQTCVRIQIPHTIEK